jgi:hypothetical protein
VLRTSTFFPNQPLQPGWPEIWATALMQPRVATYKVLARQSGVGLQSVCGWLFSSSLLGGLLISLRSHSTTPDHLFAPGLLVAILLYALLALGSWLLFALSAQWVAKRLHGQGNYTLLLTTFAAFSIPLTLITSLFSLLPYNQLPTFCFYGYWMLLYLLAIKAVNRFSWRRAISTLLLTLSIGGVTLIGLLLFLVQGFLR